MSIFEYDSKYMKFLRLTGDLIILNMLFVFFSIPLFTIGAAYSGLYTGLRELFDRDSSNSSFKSFMKGFKNGFGKITKVWTFILISLSLLSYSLYFFYKATGIDANIVKSKAPIIVAIAGIAILCLISAQLTLFHSKFDCSAMLLFKNSILMVIGFPIRSIIMAVLVYLPIGVLILDYGYTFLRLTPLWVAIYYSGASLLSSTLMKKPFEKIQIKESDYEDEDEDEEQDEEYEDEDEEFDDLELDELADNMDE